jgi:hypothetical protein
MEEILFFNLSGHLVIRECGTATIEALHLPVWRELAVFSHLDFPVT